MIADHRGHGHGTDHDHRGGRRKTSDEHKEREGPASVIQRQPQNKGVGHLGRIAFQEPAQGNGMNKEIDKEKVQGKQPDGPAEVLLGLAFHDRDMELSRQTDYGVGG